MSDKFTVYTDDPAPAAGQLPIGTGTEWAAGELTSSDGSIAISLVGTDLDLIATGGGGGGIGGSGTTGTIPIFTSLSTIGNSSITQDASNVYVDRPFTWANATGEAGFIANGANAGGTQLSWFILSNDSQPRWAFKKDSTAESGSNVGSDFAFEAIYDNGTYHDVFTVPRSTQVLDFKQTPTINGVPIGSSSGTVTSVSATVPSFLSIAGSPVTTSGTLAFTLSGTALPVTSGGLGATTFTDGGVLVGNGTGTIQATSAGTSGQVLTSNGAGVDPTFQAIPAGGTVTSVAASVPSFLSIAGSPITTAGTLAISYSGTALPVSNGGSGATTLTGYLKGNGTSAFTASSTVPTSDLSGSVNLTTQVTGTLPVANGGTGVATIAANNVVLGNGTSAVQTVAPGSSGNVLTSNGTTWESSAPSGGGNVSSSGTPVSGQAAEWVSASAIQGVATTGSGSYVKATSPTLVTPALGTPSSAVLTSATGLPLTTGVTGTLPVANGGTGATTFTDGGVLIGNTTGAVQVTTAGTSGQVLTSNGSGVDPTFQAAPSPLVTSSAAVTITGTAETSVFGSYSVAGSTLVNTGDMMQMRIPFTYLNNTGSGTITLKIKVGGSTFYNDASVSITSAPNTRICLLVIDFVRTSSTTVDAVATCSIGNSSGATTGLGDFSANPFTSAVSLTVGFVGQAWTWANATALDVTFTCSAASGTTLTTSGAHLRKLQ